MSAPPRNWKGQFTARSPLFNDQYYSWWKNMMRDYIIGEDYELCDIITDGPLATLKKNAEGVEVLKIRADCTTEDLRKWEKNAKAKKCLVCGLGPDEYSKIQSCTTAKEIWDTLQVANEGTPQVKRSRGALLRQTMKIDVPKKERSMTLKITESSLEDDEIDMITKDFKKYLRRGNGPSRSGSYNKPKERAEQRNRKKEHVQPKKTKGSTKAMVAAWGESSNESSDDEDGDEHTLMAIGESDEETKVSVIHLKDKIKFLSKERLSELLLDLIDEYEDVNNEKEQLSKECVILKAKCKNLELKVSETVSENTVLKNQVLALNSNVLELRSENLKLKLGTGKKTFDCTQLTLEENVGKLKDELYKRDEQVRIPKEDLSKVKHDLDRTCKWDRSSDALSWVQEHHSSNRRGLGFGNLSPKWDPKSKYLTLPKNKICTHCGKTCHFKSECTSREKAQVKGSSQIWYMDSGCSKQMIGNKNQFLSLEDLKRGDVSFENGKKGEIIGVGKVGKTDSHSIENVYLIDGLKYSLISVSQLYDSGNMVAFTSTKYFVINLTTDKIVLQGKRVNNIYVVHLSTLTENELTCLSVLDNDPLFWHKRLGHASLSQLNKLVSKDLVIGLPNIKFKEDKLCEACASGKQV
ncbi:uncharacterized protein [Nicotiana sylvestris]|uniref:uncharacterized protein n=1 Tax=Nicotiana sylvestris TaxID=4096 RepID=UPI00388CE4A0